MAASTAAQPVFEVIALEGTAKVQRSSKQKWEKLDVGAKINDNDMVETFFQTKLSLQFGEKNLIIFGSNSKALLSISVKEGGDKKNIVASLSLFNGGIYGALASKTHTSVFSTNAVAETDSGSFAAIVDAKVGETGILVLGGKALVRNISQQKSKELTAGNTTIILPGREPSPPLYMSFRHVAVLKHFFGDKYITDQMQTSSITPSEDRGGSSRVMLSEGMSQEKPRVDVLFYKRLFDINKIYGSILDDRERESPSYHGIEKPRPSAGHRGSVGFYGGMGRANGAVSQAYSLVPRFRYAFAEAALRFSFVQNYRHEMVTDFKTPAGLLDKIDRFTLGNERDSLFISARSIDRLTLGNGLVVDRFRAADNNRIFHPLGIIGHGDVGALLVAGAFISDVSDPSIGGLHLSLEPSIYQFGAGYYFDRNPYQKPSHSNDLRYRTEVSDTPSFPDTARVRADISIYELSFGTTVTENYDISARLYCEFAQKVHNGRNDGYMIRAPSLYFTFPKWSARGGMLFETGRIIAHEFNEFYTSRRSFMRKDSLLTANTSLWERRNVLSFFGGLGVNPLRGLDISADIEHNVRARNTYTYWGVVDSTTDTNRLSPLDFSLELRLAIDSGLTRFISFSEIYFRQMNGRLFPPGGTYFSSWNSEAGFTFVTAPVRFGLSLECGGRLFYIDMNARPNDVIDNTDRVFELFAGIRWDFL